MKNLQLLPSIHKNQAVVKVDFAFDKALIALAKAQKGVRDVRYFQELLGHIQQSMMKYTLSLKKTFLIFMVKKIQVR